MRAVARAEVLIVSLGSTPGLQASDGELAASMRRAGAIVTVAAAAAQPRVRTLAYTDWRWARAARAAAQAAIEEHQPRAIVYSTTTAALLWPHPGAIRYDAPAAATRPGRHGVWQRASERKRIAQAPLLIPTSQATLDETPGPRPPAIVVPIPVEPAGLGEPWALREVSAVTYASDPHKKGLDRVLEAWGRARREDETLVVAGLDRERIAQVPPGVEVAGRLPREQYRRLLLRSKLFVTAPRREDHGIAQLEALCDGCLLVTTPAPGPYAALAIAQALDERLVSDDLAPAIRAALDEPAPRYAERAIPLLEPFTRASVDRVVEAELLPRLLG